MSKLSQETENEFCIIFPDLSFTEIQALVDLMHTGQVLNRHLVTKPVHKQFVKVFNYLFMLWQEIRLLYYTLVMRVELFERTCIRIWRWSIWTAQDLDLTV